MIPDISSFSIPEAAAHPAAAPFWVKSFPEDSSLLQFPLPAFNTMHRVDRRSLGCVSKPLNFKYRRERAKFT